jgi:hypothetical protein
MKIASAISRLMSEDAFDLQLHLDAFVDAIDTQDIKKARILYNKLFPKMNGMDEDQETLFNEYGWKLGDLVRASGQKW